MEVIDTVVVGAGSAGLAAAWELRKANTTFAVLDAGDQPGESWSQRYDCLRLFTPARFCALPGWDLPIPPTAHPDKHQMADYLARYSERFAFPVRAKTEAQSHQFVNGRHRLITGSGDEIHARRLIVATGARRVPKKPAFAAEIDPLIRQFHSATYRAPGDLAPGPVLVVGAGTSGSDIAAELAGTREVWLAGRGTGHVPLGLVSNPLFRRFYSVRVPAGGLGRRIRDRSAPLVWQSERSLRAADVLRVPRVVGVRDGRPVLANGDTVSVGNVIWSTGLRPGYEWLDQRAVGPDGWPDHRRGISSALPGLAFVGLPFQHTLGSGFLAGMPSDAAHVVNAGRQNSY